MLPLSLIPQRLLVGTLAAGLLCFSLQPPATAAPDWQPLIPSVDVARDAVSGTWRRTDSSLTVGAAQRARLSLPVAPEGEYDLRVAFTRQTGQHSVGVVVVQGKRSVAFEVDAWGQHLAGFQNLGGRSIQENPTRRANVALENGRRYSLTVEVRKGMVRGLLDGREIATHRTDGSDLSVPDLWAMPDGRRLGLLAWESQTTFHAVDLRVVSGTAGPVARNSTPPAAPPAPTAPRTGAKRVLMVLANQDFFYREYADPRAELEQAGHRVIVAAGRRGTCVPHGNSGQGAGQGVVQAELALSEVRSQDYDAILFSGGWGSSAYQYAFPGRYDNPVYNGDPAIKAQANRLINEFIRQDKYVAALCNAVSVLAWARVEGRSPLQGKRVCAPVRQAAAGIYNGRQAQPSCRWHPEANGAVMSPPGAVGRPGTAADDVMVDGKILTGEDDVSAREMGRRLATLLAR